jgi:hypothetical protein
MQVPARVVRTAAIAAVLAIVLVLAIASSAFAAPSDQTLGLSALKDKLDASGTVPAYMKTVVKGSTITTIPVTVLAITGSDRPSSALILFEATGPLIDKYGGIVAGMSGSPIYVDDNGTDKVIGALSYGDTNTLGGTGEATPIEAMLNIQSTYAPGVQNLDHPVITSAGVINRIIITPSTAPALPGAAADGVAVAHPLATTEFVRGLSADSRLYKRLSAQLAKHNVSVVNLTTGASGAPSVGDSSFTTPFVPGSSIAALFSRGDFSYGGIGTVTYTDSSTVLAYGHPEALSGPADLYMSNAWIDGIWPSSYWPYKVGRIGALRGTITQDRSAGILGVTDQFTRETTISAHATNTATGESTSSLVYVPRSLLDTVSTGQEGYLGEELPPIAAYQAGSYLFDQASVPGSAQTTTTVVIRDTDHDKLYTITIPNYVSDGTDILSAIVWDTDNALISLNQELSFDVYHYEVLSIDLTSRITPRQNSATIVGVKLANALKTGANQVQVSFLAYGVEDTQTLNATLTIPAGVSTQGMVLAAGSGNGLGQFPSGDATGPVTSPRETIPQIVNDLNTSIPGNDLVLRYSPTPISDPGLGGGVGFFASNTALQSIVATMPTPWAVGGTAASYPTIIQAHLESKVMDYAGFNLLDGYVQGADDPGTVSLFGTIAGSSTESLLGTTTVDPADGSFEFPIEGLTMNTQLRVHVDASPDGFSAADSAQTAYVYAGTHFSTSTSSVKTGKAVTLAAKLYSPSNAGSKVVFEYFSKKAWHAIATKKLASGPAAIASTTWKALKGATKLRYRFLGGIYNYATTSVTKTVTGK